MPLGRTLNRAHTDTDSKNITNKQKLKPARRNSNKRVEKYQGANSELQTRSAVIGSCQRFRLCLLYLFVPVSIQVVTRLLQEQGLGTLGSLGTGVWRHS